MGRRGGTLTLLVVGAAVLSLAALGAEAKQKRVVRIPYEAERAAERGDKNQLRLNDDATLIPGHRVRGLPIVDGRMGEHIELDGVSVFIPFGSVISATTEIHPSRPSANGQGLEPNPYYTRVARFDRDLGPVCASERAPDREIQMRINSERALSLVNVRADGTGATAQPSYRIETSLETRYFADAALAARLYKSCLANNSLNIARN
jgi:hypothetical protein